MLNWEKQDDGFQANHLKMTFVVSYYGDGDWIADIYRDGDDDDFYTSFGRQNLTALEEAQQFCEDYLKEFLTT